jgi:hypothetical protein
MMNKLAASEDDDEDMDDDEDESSSGNEIWWKNLPRLATFDQIKNCKY